MFVWAELPGGLDATEVARAAQEDHVVFAPGRSFSSSPRWRVSCVSTSRSAPTRGCSRRSNGRSKERRQGLVRVSFVSYTLGERHKNARWLGFLGVELRPARGSQSAAQSQRGAIEVFDVMSCLLKVRLESSPLPRFGAALGAALVAAPAAVAVELAQAEWPQKYEEAQA